MDPKSKGYIRHPVAGDGDCGYTAFGITRSEAFQLLNKHIAAIQHLLIPVIKEWLLDERFIAYLKTYQHINQNTNLDYIQQHLDQYANDLTIIAAFIDFDVRDKKIDGGWAHPATLQALAHIQGIELHIWILGDNQQLLPHRRDGHYDYSCYQPPNVTQRVDLLFVNNNHFERLSFEGYENNYPSDTDDIYPIQKQVPKLSDPSLARQQVKLTQQPSIRNERNFQTTKPQLSRQIDTVKEYYQQLSKLLRMFQSALNQQHIHNISEEITQHLLPLISQIYKEVNETEANVLKMQQDKSIKDYVDQLHEYEKIFQGELDLMTNRSSNASIYASLSSEASECLVKQLNELKKQCAFNSIDVQFKTDILANLPPKNEVFTGRIEEMRQIIDQLQNQQHVSVIKQSLTGTGGVGKTQLALQFAHLAYQQKSIQNYALQYDAIAWLNGNDPSGAFFNLAELFKIDTEQFKGAELIYQVYRRLSENYSKALLIFDDVHNQDAIEDYLPQAQKNIHQFECHVLMTSRSQIWNKNQISEIVIENFSLEEAKEYIQKIIPVSDEEAEELASLLNFFPLALSQAVAYIQQTNIRIEEYIKRYQSSQQKELLEQLPRIHDYYQHQYRDLDEGQIKIQTEYAQTVFTTWYVSIALLKQQAEETGQAMNAEEILNICAYFAPQEIPYFLIQDALNISNTEMTDCLIALKNYSLIVPDNQESYQMHALLQEVVRLHFKEKEFNLNEVHLNTANTFQNIAINKITLAIFKSASNSSYLKLLAAHIDSLIIYVKETPISVETMDLLIIVSKMLKQFCYFCQVGRLFSLIGIKLYYAAEICENLLAISNTKNIANKPSAELIDVLNLSNLNHNNKDLFILYGKILLNITAYISELGEFSEKEFLNWSLKSIKINECLYNTAYNYNRIIKKISELPDLVNTKKLTNILKVEEGESLVIEDIQNCLKEQQNKKESRELIDTFSKIRTNIKSDSIFHKEILLKWFNRAFKFLEEVGHFSEERFKNYWILSGVYHNYFNGVIKINPAEAIKICEMYVLDSDFMEPWYGPPKVYNSLSSAYFNLSRKVLTDKFSCIKKANKYAKLALKLYENQEISHNNIYTEKTASWLMLGKICFLKMKYQLAIDYFKKIVELEKLHKIYRRTDIPKALYYLAKINYRLDNLDEALDYCEDCIKENKLYFPMNHKFLKSSKELYSLIQLAKSTKGISNESSEIITSFELASRNNNSSADFSDSVTSAKVSDIFNQRTNKPSGKNMSEQEEENNQQQQP